MSLMMRAWGYFRVNLLSYLIKFGLVGAVGFAVDVTIFNILRITVASSVPFFGSPIGAKTTSTALAILVTWLGNRYWTFRRNRRRDYLVEFLEFTGVALGGMAISLFCLWLSHYVFGFTSLLADNISTNVIGFGLATLFRFFLYRYWVFGLHRRAGLRSPQGAEATAAAMTIFEDELNASIDADKVLRHRHDVGARLDSD